MMPEGMDMGAVGNAASASKQDITAPPESKLREFTVALTPDGGALVTETRDPVSKGRGQAVPIVTEQPFEDMATARDYVLGLLGGAPEPMPEEMPPPPEAEMPQPPPMRPQPMRPPSGPFGG